MRLYRICRAPYRALDGEGARLYGGRWNSPGSPVVYASSSLALAALEYLVHLDPDHAPSDLIALTLEVPDTASADEVHGPALPPDWAQVADHPACVAAGDAWLGRGVTLLLRVPAAPVPEEQNVLINPRHVEAAQVRVVAERPFAFDPRLLP